MTTPAEAEFDDFVGRQSNMKHNDDDNIFDLCNIAMWNCLGINATFAPNLRLIVF